MIPNHTDSPSNGVYIPNSQIYAELQGLKHSVTQLKTIVSLFSFVLTPVISVIASLVIGGQIG